jgi:hypothetical protein
MKTRLAKDYSLNYFLQSIDKPKEHKITIAAHETPVSFFLGIKPTSKRTYVNDMLLLEPGIYYINYVQFLSSGNSPVDYDS